MASSLHWCKYYVLFILIIVRIYFAARFGTPVIIKDFVDRIIFAFVLWALFCSITQPAVERNPGFLTDLKFNIQHVYWMILFLFVKNNYQRIDMKLIGFYAFIGSIFLIFFYNFLPMELNLGLGSFATTMGRNSFVYQIECVVPLVMLFLLTKSFRYNFFFLSMYFLITLLTNGRAGTIIVMLYLVGFLIISKRINVRITLVLGILVPIFMGFGFLNSNKIIFNLSEGIRPLNDRVANLLLQEDDGDLDFDKSWIERQIHISKGLEIFDRYPIKGVGLNHFMYFDTDYSSIDLNNYIIGDVVRITEKNLEEFNQRSAHNSYIQILAETGIVGLGLYVSFFLPLLSFVINYLRKNVGNLEMQDILLVGVVLISFHNWVISAYSGAISFAIFGLGYGRMMELKQRFSK